MDSLKAILTTLNLNNRTPKYIQTVLEQMRSGKLLVDHTQPVAYVYPATAGTLVLPGVWSDLVLNEISTPTKRMVELCRYATPVGSKEMLHSCSALGEVYQFGNDRPRDLDAVVFAPCRRHLEEYTRRPFLDVSSPLSWLQMFVHAQGIPTHYTTFDDDGSAITLPVNTFIITEVHKLIAELLVALEEDQDAA